MAKAEQTGGKPYSHGRRSETPVGVLCACVFLDTSALLLSAMSPFQHTRTSFSPCFVKGHPASSTNGHDISTRASLTVLTAHLEIPQDCPAGIRWVSADKHGSLEMQSARSRVSHWLACQSWGKGASPL